MSCSATTAPGVARRPRDRKAAILEAAADLFAGQGFVSVGIDDIAAAVGVTGPAIYRHFPGKDAILAEVVSTTVTSLATRTAGLSSGDAGQEELVTAAVTFALDSPTRLATYLRERPRLRGAADRAVAELEGRINQAWSNRLHEEMPALDDRRVVIRERAAIGALSAAALRRRDAGPARVGSLLTQSVLAMLAIDPVADAPPPPERGWEAPVSRREELLTAAVDLFRRRGFRGVGIDEIGEAVGISGSAVYRHFGAKTDILVDAYDRAGARVAVGAEEALAHARSPVEALAGLTGSYARVALDNVDLIVVTSREGAGLPASERPRFSRRRRALRDTWVGVLRQGRSDLSEPEARLLVATTLALITSAGAAMARGDQLAGEVSALALAYCLGRPSEPSLTAHAPVG